jgi:hypothetical protein
VYKGRDLLREESIVHILSCTLLLVGGRLFVADGMYDARATWNSLLAVCLWGCYLCWCDLVGDHVFVA